MSAQADSISMRDALYEAPGPRTRRRILVGTVISLAVATVLVALVVRQFYVTGQLDPKYWEFFTRLTTWRFLGEGFLGTVEVALVAAAISLVLGLVLMLGRISTFKPLAAVCHVIINFFRGVPSLLLIYFFFLVIPTYGVKMSSFWMITLPIALAASGVLAEVFRAGVNAVPKGQVEAALSLGLRKHRVMFKIVLPQALRIVIPSLVSQLVVVVKDTTVAYIVSFPDLMQNARVLITNYDALVSVYFVVAILYILVNYAINQASVNLARRSGAPVITRTTESPV
jgi:glutamate transport system permease protein